MFESTGVRDANGFNDIRLAICLFLIGSGVAFYVSKAAIPAAFNPSVIRFQNEQAVSRTRFVLDNCNTPDKPIIDSVLGGVALLDFDGDGYLDIYFTNGTAATLIKEPEAALRTAKTDS